MRSCGIKKRTKTYDLLGRIRTGAMLSAMVLRKSALASLKGARFFWLSCVSDHRWAEHGLCDATVSILRTGWSVRGGRCL